MICGKKNKNGSALAMVLVFMVIMSILGAGVLALAQHSAVQSRAVAQADRGFYAAESAAQLAAQVLLKEFEGYDFIERGGIVLESELDAVLSSLETRIRGEVSGRLAIAEATASALLIGGFNGEDASFAFEIPDWESNIIKSSEIEDIRTITDEEGEFAGYQVYCSAVVYIDSPQFVITGTSGGRTVTAMTGFTTKTEVQEPDVTEPSSGFVLQGGLASYQDETGGVYGVSNTEVYESYITALEKLISNAKIRAASRAGGAGILPDDMPGRAAQSGMIHENADRINTWSPVKLGENGRTTVYEDLEYIRGENGIAIHGEVICPNLKGIVITGGSCNIYGTLKTSVLEDFYIGGNLSIHEGAKINPIPLTGGGSAPANGGLNIYAGRVDIAANTEVNWSRFYMRDGIYIGHISSGSGYFRSNSIYISTNNTQIKNGITFDSSGPVPQFYSENSNFDMYAHSYTGIFMTLCDKWLFNNGNSNPVVESLTGIFIGNMIINDRTNPDGSKSPWDIEVEPFNPANIEYMMDNGLISETMEGEGVDTPGKVEVEITIEVSPNGGLRLRETTGE